MKIADGTFAGLAGEEVELFRKVLAGVGGIGVEIGCLDGYSSAVILDASELHLTSIDPFIPDSMEINHYNEHYQAFLFLGIVLALLELLLGERKAEGRIWRGRFEVPQQ